LRGIGDHHANAGLHRAGWRIGMTVGELRVGVDIGGTFTDLCLMDDTGIIAVGKVLTTPDEPARAVEEVIAEVLKRSGAIAPEIERLVHGTTLVTNALIERKGARCAVLATAGFRDVLEIAHEHRFDLYDLMIELPTPLVPRWLRFDVPERMYADGTIATPLDEAYVAQLAVELVEAGVEAVAIAFLHSYSNPTHERQARAVIQRVAPSLRVALSSEVVPEIREFERTSTTVANIYVQGLAERYLNDLRSRAAGLGIVNEPHILLSNGGVATVATAAQFPIRMLESGPAGGALAAAAFGIASRRPDLMAFDMGGTTAKLCLIEDGEPLITHSFEVDRVYRMRAGSGLPVSVPVIDMIEIGVGGGSIARINALGLLTVGPDSSGSVPGPVCYGRGGTLPTVTDADLVLGYLDPGYFLGGRMSLDVEGARAAIAAQIAEPLGVSVAEAAWGIHTSVNEDMASAARVHAVERGKDPTALPLFTFGGAGPVHGVGVARALRARQVIAPPAAGVMSAAGMLTGALSFDFVRSLRVTTTAVEPATLDALFAEMEAEGLAILTRSGVAAGDVTHARFAEMRYVGQGSEIRVALRSPVANDLVVGVVAAVDRSAPMESGSGPRSAASVAEPEGHAPDEWSETLLTAFETQYERLYHRAGPEVPVEALTWRVVSSGPAPHAVLRRPAFGSTSARKGSREAYFADLGGYVETAVYDRYGLSATDVIDGPAIVEEQECTLVIPSGCRCTVGEDGSLIVDLGVPK
jgi:N-methylhydantoinase A